VGLVLVLLLHNQSPVFYAAATLAVFVLGVYSAGSFERATGEKDSRKIVIDEIAGMLLVGFLLPSGAGYWVAGFILFRAFDVLKPFPAGWVERNLPGGWGIMLDDSVAGLYANLLLQGVKAWMGHS